MHQIYDFVTYDVQHIPRLPHTILAQEIRINRIPGATCSEIPTIMRSRSTTIPAAAAAYLCSLLTLSSLFHPTRSFLPAPQVSPASLAHTGRAVATSTKSENFKTSLPASSTDQASDSRMGNKQSQNKDEILEPEGDHHGPLSLAPLSEVAQWGASPGAYFKGLSEANGGAPIYKAHPGLACIVLSDHASGEWFFKQPDTVLDRQDGQKFGPLQCRPEYLGESYPALVTNAKENHTGIRDYTIAILRERASATQTALDHAMENFYKELWTNGMGDSNTVFDTMLKQSHQFMLEWVFGTGEEGGQPLPPFEDFRNVNPTDSSVLIKLELDTPAADAAIQAAQALQGGVSAEQKASVEVLLNTIRSSRMWPKYLEMQKEYKIEMLNLENSFMFNTGFQSSAAIAKNMEYAVGTLTANPDFLAELRKEVDGKELTIKSVANEKEFPLLNSFHWEILRMFPAPPFFFKSAKKDLVVPTSSGKKYQIREGDMLCCHQPLVQIDEAVFGADAKEFKPKRFMENPGLKKEVFAFAFPDPSKVDRVEGMPWGCAAHATGVLEGILKCFYGRWVQEATWEMVDPPIIDEVAFLGSVGPKGMSFTSVSPRK